MINFYNDILIFKFLFENANTTFLLFEANFPDKTLKHFFNATVM